MGIQTPSSCAEMYSKEHRATQTKNTTHTSQRLDQETSIGLQPRFGMFLEHSEECSLYRHTLCLIAVIPACHGAVNPNWYGDLECVARNAFDSSQYHRPLVFCHFLQ